MEAGLAVVTLVSDERDTRAEAEPSIEEPRTSQIVVLVPAHNEEEAIEETLQSLHRQTRPVDRIIVVCDNCTDRTEEIIEPLDCETFRSKGNTQKKAGALNQALIPLYATMADNDKVLVMDADSILDERFVDEASKLLDDDPQIGAVSAAYVGKDKPGFLPMLQRIEYVHERRRVARRQARVTCLSGTAAMFTMAALRHLLAERGKTVPGQAARPEAYLSVSLTEDFEITLAMKAIGYSPLSPKTCISHTDVMPTVSMLWSQRLRWQRGTLETLRLYGFTRLTYRMYLTQIYTYAMSLATPLMILLWMISLFVLHTGLVFSWLILMLLPLSAIEQFIATFRLRDWKASLTATTIIIMWMYDNMKVIIYWHALLKLLKRTEFEWD
jgi:cellulose synthase/poly-beta-1,6-N-acetylglucosamine synthase-like glycosyltransferase